MIPSDAPPEDWGLYYCNTYMMHNELGPVYIDHPTDDEKLFVRIVLKNGIFGDGHIVNPKDLHMLWIKPGAYNFRSSKAAMFIGRTSRRHMKRSSANDHYFVTWHRVPVSGGQMLGQLCNPSPYFTINDVSRKLWNGVGQSNKKWKCIALSRRVVIAPPLNGEGPYEVIYDAEDFGTLNGTVCTPYQNHDSRLVRIRRQLERVGITCKY